MEFFSKKKNIRKKNNPHMTMMVIPHGNGKNIKSFCLPVWLLKLGVFACLACVLTIGYFIKGYFHLQYIAMENEELRKVNADQSVKLEELTAFTGNMRNQLKDLMETDQEIRAKVGLTKPSEKKQSANDVQTASYSFDKYVFMNLSLGDLQANTANSPVIPYNSPVLSSSDNKLVLPLNNNKLALTSGNKSTPIPSRQQTDNYFSSQTVAEGTTQVMELPVSDDEIDTLDELKEELLKMDNLINEQSKNMDKLKVDVEKQLAFQNAVPNAWPVQGRVTSNFGWRQNPFSKKGSEHHDGIDFGASYGSPVRASGDGVVTFSGYKSGWGNVVIISHGYGYVSQYAHNSSLLVKAGTKVKRGQVIARVGSTGRSTGTHLHFGIAKNGQWIDPKKVLK